MAVPSQKAFERLYSSVEFGGLARLLQVMVGGMALAIRSFHGSKLEGLNLTHSSMAKPR